MSNANYFFKNFPTGNPPAVHNVHDFLTDEELTEFVATAISSGTSAVIDTEVGGVLRLSGAATTDDSGNEVQQDAGWVLLVTDKRIKFSARVRFGESTSTNMPTQSDFFCGIATLDTSIIASAPTNGIYFRKDDGDDYLDVVIRTGAAEITAIPAVYTLSKDVWYRLEIDIQMGASSGVGTVTFYVDGTAKYSATYAAGLPASTSAMSKFCAFQTGAADGTKYVDLDWLAVEVQR